MRAPAVDVRLYTNVFKALTLPVMFCISPRCKATNWGGTDRLHFRDGACQKFTSVEREELERFVSNFETVHEWKLVYCSECDMWYKNFTTGVYSDIWSMKETDLDDNHTYHKIIHKLDNRARRNRAS